MIFRTQSLTYSLWSSAILILLGAPIHAQDWTAGVAARTLERPAHKALIARIMGSDATLSPFESDGCSGGLSDAWQVVASRFPDFAEMHQSSPPWEGCCVAHDRAYHAATGALDASTSFDGRLMADRDLEACVVRVGADRVDALAKVYQVNPDQIAGAYDSIAQAMFLAVRFGGAPCSGLSWRWGFGYPPCSVVSGVFD